MKWHHSRASARHGNELQIGIPAALTAGMNGGGIHPGLTHRVRVGLLRRWTDRCSNRVRVTFMMWGVGFRGGLCSINIAAGVLICCYEENQS